MLECLTHAGIGRVPRTHVAVEIAIAEAVAVERHDESGLPAGWDHADLRVARALGDAWLRERRTAVLVVPSVVARREGNILINPQHPDSTAIVASKPELVVWDARLFAPHRVPGSSDWSQPWRPSLAPRYAAAPSHARRHAHAHAHAQVCRAHAGRLHPRRSQAGCVRPRGSGTGSTHPCLRSIWEILRTRCTHSCSPGSPRRALRRCTADSCRSGTSAWTRPGRMAAAACAA